MSPNSKNWAKIARGNFNDIAIWIAQDFKFGWRKANLHNAIDNCDRCWDSSAVAHTLFDVTGYCNISWAWQTMADDCGL
jgi:hypothetical protein